MAGLNFLFLTMSCDHLDEETVFCMRSSLHLLCDLCYFLCANYSSYLCKVGAGINYTFFKQMLGLS